MLHLILYYYIKSVPIRKFNWLSYSVFHSDTPINALKFLDVVNMKDTQQKSQFYKSTLIEAMPLIPRVSGAHFLLLLIFFFSTGNGCSPCPLDKFLGQRTDSTLIINGANLCALRANNLWITGRFMSVAKMYECPLFSVGKSGRGLCLCIFFFGPFPDAA